MCGICGEYYFDSDRRASEKTLLAMESQIAHRGPNDEGHFTSGPCGLGFRRLSIIDLSGGHQPIPNEDETIWVTLNGEIYNYPELRRDLEARGHIFRTHSDTEVIVHLYEEHGLHFCDHLRGMFGIALYDIEKQQLVLARDRIGIKPVYYWQDHCCIVYASEIKAVLAHPNVSSEPDEAAVFELLWYRSSLTPGTMFKNIRKLPAGSMLVANKSGAEISQWWRLQPGNAAARTFDEAVANYEEALGEAVDVHLRSDVPVGLYLSGGLDSSVLASFIRERSSQPVTSFTAAFEGNRNESPFAATVARHLDVEHRVLNIRPPDLDLIEEIVWHLDEPIADPACVPTYLLSREASQHVRVILAGEGSDETNAGYAKLLRHHLFSSHPALFSAAKWSWPLLKHIGPLASRFGNYRPLWDTQPGLARLLANDQTSLHPTPFGPETLIPRFSAHRKTAIQKLQARLDACSSSDSFDRLMHYVRTGFMEEGLLMKLDRMTMAHGLEARVPYLDHHLVELSASTPPEHRLRGRRTKAVLRAIAEKRLPAEIACRKQHGFLVPLDQWFGGSFADTAASLLSPAVLRKREMFDAEAVGRLLNQYRATGQNARTVWTLVILELWFRRFID